jgi:hypothetical protein
MQNGRQERSQLPFVATASDYTTVNVIDPNISTLYIYTLNFVANSSQPSLHEKPVLVTTHDQNPHRFHNPNHSQCFVVILADTDNMSQILPTCILLWHLHTCVVEVICHPKSAIGNYYNLEGPTIPESLRI